MQRNDESCASREKKEWNHPTEFVRLRGMRSIGAAMQQTASYRGYTTPRHLVPQAIISRVTYTNRGGALFCLSILAAV
jgi:hypothetical protein